MFSNCCCKTYLVLCILSMGMWMAKPASADFVVRSEYQSPLPYGNGELVCFRNAIVGSEPAPEEIRALERELPQREVGRYYGRADLSIGNLVLNQIRNRSSGAFQSALVSKKKATKSQTGLQLAIGYVFAPDTRAELEYLVNKNFNYSTSPVFSNRVSGSLNAQIKNNILLLTGYYDFLIDRFRPYVMASIGIAANDTTATISPAPSGNNQFNRRIVTFAWGVGLGFRVSMFTRWFFDMNYRYVQLGSTEKFQPNSNIVLQGIYGMNAISVGLIYLF